MVSKYKRVFFIALAMCAEACAQNTIFPASTIPATPADPEVAAITLGVQFSSDVPGVATGVRFYKSSANTGTHIGKLWSASGTLLASVTFSAETASGWQQATFSNPVAISANSTYIVSYYTSAGRYADDQNYSWSSINAAPLRVSGSSPGVYSYGDSFPTQAWNSSNYYVDVVFSPSQKTVSFWNTSAMPDTPSISRNNAATLGLTFSADVSGTVSGLRFFKGVSNTGSHTGALWTASGVQLATVGFSGESASGWQTAMFTPPVRIYPGTPYVIAYYAPNGGWASSDNYSWTALNAAPLHVVGTSPGVYGWGATLPNNTSSNSNYWIDVLFVPDSSQPPIQPPIQPPTTTYSISGTVTGSPATLTLSGTSSGTTNTDSAGKYLFSGLANGSYVVAPSQSGMAFSPSTASVNVNGAAVNGVNFAATAVPAPAPSHSVSLSWSASASPNVTSYNVYRGPASGGPYSKLTTVGATSFTDQGVTAGQQYFYVTTAMDSNGVESVYSNEAAATIPIP